MGLKDIQIPKVDVVVGADSFAVRGLSALDIDLLVRKQGPVLQELFAKFVSGKPGKKPEATADMASVFKEIVVTAPALVVEVIALSTDADEEERATIARLPVSVQINALLSIVSLSLAGTDDMGKFLDAALKLTGALNGGMGALLAEVVDQTASPVG